MIDNRKKVLLDPLIVGIVFGMVVSFGIFNFIKETSNILGIVDIHTATNIFKILFAALSGSLIGFERESKNRPAGLRTHALVSIGAALVMIIPFEIIANGQNLITFDVTRLGAQVISGIGFLGAGTIIRNGNSVKGLTTAASLWVAAIIGLTIGAGNYFTSIIATIIVIFILVFFGNFEHRQTLKNRNMEFVIITKDLRHQIFSINSVVEKFNLKLRKIEVVEENIDDDNVKIRVLINVPSNIENEVLFNEFEKSNHVVKVVNY